MTNPWIDRDGLEHGGGCNECGQPVEADHHAYCGDCYAEQQGWTVDDENDDEAVEERDR